jgi:hypothetical protein
MATPAPKKRSCCICGAEHNVGEACPQCAWDQEKEEAMAKAEVERKRLRESQSEPPRRKGFFNY